MPCITSFYMTSLGVHGLAIHQAESLCNFKLSPMQLNWCITTLKKVVLIGISRHTSQDQNVFYILLCSAYTGQPVK